MTTDSRTAVGQGEGNAVVRAKPTPAQRAAIKRLAANGGWLTYSELHASTLQSLLNRRHVVLTDGLAVLTETGWALVPARKRGKA